MTTPKKPITALTDPDNVEWVIESIPLPDETGGAVASGAEPEVPAFDMADAVPGVTFISRMPPDLQAYWLAGPGAAKIRWGTEGSFRRCVREMRDYFPQNPEGLCANLYHEATGHWPGENRNK